MKIVAVSDISATIYDPNGLNLKEIDRYLQTKAVRNRTLLGYPDAQTLDSTSVIEVDTDILVPAALGNQIHSTNCDGIKAKLIVEGANGPTTPHADEKLRSKGVRIIPDILANAGGVTVSFLEWHNNMQAYEYAEESEYFEASKKELEKRILKAYRTVRDKAKNNNVDMRTAAYMIGIDRVHKRRKKMGFN